MIPRFGSLIFLDGVMLADGKLAFAAFPHRPGRPQEASGTRILWFDAGSWFDGGLLHFAAVGIAPLAATHQAIVVLGRDGEVAEVHTDRAAIHSLPGVLGPMRGIRSVAGEIFAYGMNRQIFRRQSSGMWERWDMGISQPDHSNLPLSARIRLGIDNMGGINAVDADASGRLCAVGFRGEIFEREMNLWQAVDSPTNVILQDICADSEQGFYACGSSGTILHSPVPHVWKLVQHDAPPSAGFTSLSAFGSKLYLADGHCLRVLVGDTCEVQSMGVAGEYQPSSRLFATQDALLSVAGREIYRTRDGRAWETILQ
jgi:hypothetical protein